MRNWWNFLIAILFILMLPFLIPYALICQALFRFRLKRAARLTACPKCGSIFGDEALALADERWRQHVAELHRQNPGVRLRLVRLVYAICVSCGASLRFDEKTQQFEITTPIPQLVEDSHDHRS